MGLRRLFWQNYIMRRKHYFILLLTLLSLKSFATHIVGGEIFYNCIGGNNYQITLKLYRDCFNGLAPYDNPATLFIFNNAGTLVDSVEIPFPGSVVLPFPLNNPCLTPPTNICVEQAIYHTTINLPPLAGGYDIVYQRCCRNGTILNLISPGSVGSTYMAHIPDPGLAVCNSSPHYNNFPPIFLCAGVPLNFDHSATDVDGDSLYYELCDAFTGLDPNCPILGPQTAFGCPPLASPPPYAFVPWLSPYSGTYPLGSSPALAIDHTTGLMTGTPNTIGQFVVAVCVSEYRHGVLLDVNKRDFQFNVVNCGQPVASIPTQQPFCFGQPSNFSQNSLNAFSYHWDFGDPGTSLDTSNVISPSWTYAAIGTYTVSLIVNPHTLCADTAAITVNVNPLPAMTNANTATICSGGTLSIPLTSSIPSNYSWVAANNPNTTGESITAQTGSTITNTITNNTVNVQTVIYTVTPTSNPGNCVGNAQTITVTVNPSPAMTNPNNVAICSGGTVNIPLTGSSASAYTWIATDNLNTTGESTTTQTGSPLNNTITNNTASIQTVTYTITPTSSPQGCAGTPQTLTVLVVPPPTMTSPASASICSGGTVSIPLTGSLLSTYSWIAADNPNTTGESLTTQTGSPLSNTITDNAATVQTVTYTVTPTTIIAACAGTPQTVTVTVSPPPAMTNLNTATICSGDAVTLSLTSSIPSTFSWIAANNPNTTGESITAQTGSTLTNTIISNALSVQTVTYTVTPTSTPGGCAGIPQTITVTVNPSPAMTNPNNAAICSGATVNIPLTSSSAAAYTWIAADNLNTTGESTTLQTGSPLNNTITNTVSSTQSVIYTVTPTSSPQGCAGTPQTITVSVIPPPSMTSPLSAVICSGGTVSIPLTSSLASSYTWIASDNLNTTGESTTLQTGSPLSNTITNNSTSTQTVTYTVTPTSTLGTCPGTPQTVNVSVSPPPTMTSLDSAVICSGSVVTIPLTSSVACTYTWIATDNVNTTGESLTPQSGSPLSNTISTNLTSIQTVTYTVTPTSIAGNCPGTPQTVTVTVNPAPTMTSPDTAFICSGSTVNIPLTSNFICTYTWIANDNLNTTGESITTQNGSPLNNTITNNSSSNQNVDYTVTPILTIGTCAGIPQHVTVTVLAPPSMTSPPTAVICSDGTVNIPFTSDQTSTYTWIAADNANTTGESTTAQTGNSLINTITNGTSSVQTVTYTVTPTSSPAGCLGNPQTITVTVNPGIRADFDFVSLPCTNQVTFYDSSAAAPVSWLWHFDDGNSSTVQNPSHTYNSAGTFNVQLIASTINGCKDTVVVQVNLAAAIPVTVSQGGTICKGNNIQLTATGGFAYIWSPSAGLSSAVIFNPLASPDTTTIYNVAIATVNSLGDTCVKNLSTTVHVIDPGLYSISASASPDTILQGQTSILHAHTDTTLTVTWTPAAGMNNSHLFNPTVSPETTTVYTVSILDSAGCPKTAEVTVYVKSIKCNASDIFVPNTFTPNGDGSNDVLYVRGNEIKEVYFAVYNRFGQMVFETRDLTKGWDGFYNGMKEDPAVFAWYINAKCFNGDEVKKKGNVTLIR